MAIGMGFVSYIGFSQYNSYRPPSCALVFSGGEITMDLEYVKKWHPRLWRWLADNPQKSKTEWPEWGSNGGEVEETESYCFCCEYALEVLLPYPSVELEACDVCPIEWPGGGCEAFTDTYPLGIYRKWAHSQGEDQRSRLALAIANMPWKE